MTPLIPRFGKPNISHSPRVIRRQSHGPMPARFRVRRCATTRSAIRFDVEAKRRSVSDSLPHGFSSGDASCANSETFNHQLTGSVEGRSICGTLSDQLPLSVSPGCVVGTVQPSGSPWIDEGLLPQTKPAPQLKTRRRRPLRSEAVAGRYSTASTPTYGQRHTGAGFRRLFIQLDKPEGTTALSFLQSISSWRTHIPHQSGDPAGIWQQVAQVLPATPPFPGHVVGSSPRQRPTCQARPPP